MSLRALLASALFAAGSVAQLSGTVGTLTTSAEKAAVKVCNILDYGGVASIDTDNAAALSAAWTACASGGQVYIPAGDYGLATWVTLKHGSGVSINIEGTIHRTGTAGGNMIFIELSTDLEIYSATATGAIQALGYEFHQDGEYGPRILRLYRTTNFTIHDIALVDSPQFHLTLDTCESGEVYNTIIHGGYEGGLDGIDVSGSNIWIHDVEVSNKDECVTVKNPSDHFLIESVHCNWSGGCAMGSLSTNTDIHDIEYRNIYTHHSNQMYMFKSNGGNGSVYNVALNNFVGHTNAYTLDLDTAWSKQTVGAGDGIVYHDISVDEWSGTCQSGVQRGPVRLLCPAAAPCYDVNVTRFDVATESGTKEYYVCANAYGSGACLQELEAGALSATASYATTTLTVTATSTAAYSTMDNELSTGFDISSSIPVPTIPASFFPGIAPKSAILSASAGVTVANAVNAAAVSSSTATPVAASSSHSSASVSATPTASSVATTSALLVETSASAEASTAAASSVAVSSALKTSSVNTSSSVNTFSSSITTSVVAATTSASLVTSTTAKPTTTLVTMPRLRPTLPANWSGRWPGNGFRGKRAE